MSTFDHKKIEKKWIEQWDNEVASGKSNWLFDEKMTPGVGGDDVEKLYILDMFPYPSGSGLHVGHVEEKVALDIYSRYKRAKGANVLFPTGYDSFGLPTENYALKNDLTPQVATKQNTAKFHEQTKKLGISYDWTRELAASDPEYYKFTQWWFTFLYERGLAYRKKQTVNWCPQDQTVLANEQVIDGRCERCDSEVVQKNIEQWFFKITDYAERLLSDLEKLDWPESTKMGQRNWIGKSEGIEIDYQVPVVQRVVAATGNPSKVDRLRKLVDHLGLGIEVVDPKDLGIGKLDIEENGDSLKENALFKARAYMKAANMPAIGMDGGFWIDGEDLDGEKVKRNALGGKNEKDLSQQEVCDLMIEFYQSIARKHGGEVDAEFRDTVALVTPDGDEYTADSVRPMLLTDRVHEGFDINFPLRALYITKLTGKNPRDHKPEDLFIEYGPYIEAIKNVVSKTVTVFTTRPDTNFGATFIAVAPDSKFVQENINLFPNKEEAEKYVKESLKKTDRERQMEGKKKTGADTGLYAINKLNGEKMPIWISDFVLGYVGTGALVGVPGHDMRDFQFAQTFDLPIKRVVIAPDGDASEITKEEQVQEDAGKMVNSGFLDGLEIMKAKEQIMDFLEKEGWGRRKVTYKLRDWSISRQRYWGAPIPMLYKDLDTEEARLNELYQEKPDFVATFHAWGSDPSRTFHPWVDKQLASMGIRSVTPKLPNADMPKIDEWLSTMEKSATNVSENSVVVARSLGAPAAMKFAEKQNLRKVILVCPVTVKSVEKDLAEFENGEGDMTKEQMEMFKDFVDYKNGGNIDFDKYNKNVTETVVFLSTDDPYIPLEETEKYLREKIQNLRVIVVRNADHFTSDAGFEQFPKLIDEIIRPVRLDLISLDIDDLPVVLPEDVDYRPQGTAPLGTSKVFDKSIDEKKYGKGVSREIDTMDTFVCSSWYFFRFIDPRNSEIFANLEKSNKFGPVDFYMGGAEHTVLHLLYARFFTKVAYDAGLIDFDEPFMKLRHQGLILGPDGRKMSKRWGNVIDPNDIVEEHGADTIRMYEMFMGPLDQMKPWSDGGVRGVSRFLKKVWDLGEDLTKKEWKVSDDGKNNLLRVRLNELLKSTEESILDLRFNTVVSDFMKYVNLANENDNELDRDAWATFLVILHSFAPFIASEMWARLQGIESDAAVSDQVYGQKWPKALKVEELKDETITIAVMVNGKVRDNLQVHKGTSEGEAIGLAKKSENVMRHVEDFGKVKKKIFVPDKILNLVV